MFDGAASFNADLGSWAVGKVTDMARAFKGAVAFNQVRRVGRPIPRQRRSIRFRLALRTYAPWGCIIHRTCGGPNEIKKNTITTNVPALLRGQDLSGWRLSSARTVELMFDGASAFVEHWQAVVDGWKGGKDTDTVMAAVTDLHRIVELRVTPEWAAAVASVDMGCEVLAPGNRIRGRRWSSSSGEDPASTAGGRGPRSPSPSSSSAAVDAGAGCVYYAGGTYNKNVLVDAGQPNEQ